MIVPFRVSALLCALSVIVGVGVATAQTVVVAGTTPESTAEIALNAAVVGSATADAEGVATLAVNLSEHRGKDETDARIVVDTCDDLTRVALVELAMQPPPLRQGCARDELVGLFVVRQVTTLVVRVGDAGPTVRVRQGPAPAAWLLPPAAEEVLRDNSATAPTGLVLSGGGGFAMLRDAIAASCGSLSDCSGKERSPAYAVGVTYWITQFLAADASYVRPSKVTAQGDADYYRFTSAFDPHILSVGGKVGVSTGIVRLYGQAGATYHHAVSTTVQTIDDQVITVDEGTVTIPGGTQTFELRTAGWSWTVGGGGEAWATSRLALYGEYVYASLKGPNLDADEGLLDDRAHLFLFGGRIRIF